MISVWIEKGLGMIVTGFEPSPLGHVTRYVPTAPEVLIALGIYGLGALMITMLYKTALSVRGEVASAAGALRSIAVGARLPYV